MSPAVQKNSFAKNVITLLTGTVVAQALPIAVMPILTRLYSPSDFGVLAVFVAIITILGVIANARYELAIVLPEEDEDAVNLVALGLLIALVLFFISLVIVVLFGSYIAGWIGYTDFWWLYLIPFSLLFSGLYNVLSYYNIRIKAYKDISLSNVYKGIVLAASQILLGILSFNKVGLIVGQFLSQFFSNFRLLKNIWGKRKLVTVELIKSNAKRYIDFPKYSVWGVFANSLSVNLIQLIMPILYSLTILGFYSVVQKLLGMPTSLIGNSIGQVYFQEANKEKKEKNNCKSIFERTLKKLTLISIVLFVPLYFLCEFLFGFFLGREWSGVYQYAQILIPMFAIRFVAISLSNTTNIFERQKLALLCQLLLLVINLLVIGFALVYHMEIFSFLKLLAFSLSIYYIALLYVLYCVSRGEK
ncbi:hypothetical protein EAH57_13000 [Acinetobacter sp. 2JN-4]|uniref:lipopolysaccharide biosynthesis protein n=1 Tax=Acinetobacter sp. 2JN-4 TaxID=2479844 RepID=UPI000EF9E6E9|nr:oligosaccharide flippase family protein [Acinetobacter sp. 2JN-4]RLZ07474.1 hypothetical protein EAH57_13000 [Acinetobacter sp. 2JN-4]